MISVTRLKIDSITQLILAVLTLLGLLLTSWKWAAAGLIILGLWQVGSALELYLDYRYKNRRNYLLLIPILPAGFWILPVWEFAPLAIFGLAYGWQTWRDYLIVSRRPRSFWEL